MYAVTIVLTLTTVAQDTPATPRVYGNRSVIKHKNAPVNTYCSTHTSCSSSFNPRPQPNQLKSEDINFIRGTAEFCRHPSCLNVNPTRESLSIHHVILGILLYNLLMNMDSNKTLLMAKI